jgi:hypothetical protein
MNIILAVWEFRFWKEHCSWWECGLTGSGKVLGQCENGSSWCNEDLSWSWVVGESIVSFREGYQRWWEFGYWFHTNKQFLELRNSEVFLFISRPEEIPKSCPKISAGPSFNMLKLLASWTFLTMLCCFGFFQSRVAAGT